MSNVALDSLACTCLSRLQWMFARAVRHKSKTSKNRFNKQKVVLISTIFPLLLFSHVWSAKYYQGIQGSVKWDYPGIIVSSTQSASSWHPQPQLSLGQRPSRGRGISRNALWLSPPSLFVHKVWLTCNDTWDE